MVRGDGMHRVIDAICLICFNLLLFESSIQAATGFTLIDELCVLALVASALGSVLRRDPCGWWAARSRSCNAAIATLALLALLVAVGLLGNLVHAVQLQLVPIAIDIFAFVKFPVSALSAWIVMKDRKRLYRLVLAEAKLLVSFMLILAIANLCTDIGMGTDPRYGLRASFKFVLPHPTFVSFGCAGIIILMLPERRDNLGWIVACLVVCALTLRTKSLGFVALAALWLFATRGGRTPSLGFALVALIAVFAIGFSQLRYYFFTDGFARAELMRASVRIAADCSPIGSGFATFGSNVTASPQYYSPLYYAYGLSTVWGLEPGAADFVSDSFWSTVIAQTGWLGLLLYIAMIAMLFWALCISDARRAPSVLCCLCYLLISSTSESAFFNPASIFLAFCLGLARAANAGMDAMEMMRRDAAALPPDRAEALSEMEGSAAPAVSVVVPVYQAGSYLRACVDSILGQTLGNLELILVDDGSCDGSGAIADGCARMSPRVKVIHAPHGGAASARNRGIDAASGRYVAFVDADDWLEPQMYERLCRCAAASGAQIVYCGMKEVHRGEVRSVRRQALSGHMLRGAGEIARFRCGFYGALPCKKREEDVLPSACTAVFERSLLMERDVRFRDVRSEDIVFNIEACKEADAIAFIGDTGYCYRKDGQPSATSSFDDGVIESFFCLFELMQQMASDEPEETRDECLLRARRFIIDYSRVLVMLIARSSVAWDRKGELIDEACSSSALRAAQEGYPFWKLPATQAVFFIGLRARAVSLLMALVKLRGAL